MTLRGYDASHYDAPSIASAAGVGFTFSTHKIGGDGRDTEFAAWWNLVRGYPPERHLPGAYFVLRPDLTGTAADKADAFISLLDTYGPGWRDRPFILQIDAEKWSGDQGTVPSLAYLNAHCDRLTSRAPSLRPIVYGPKWVYGNALAGLRYPLWASSYVSGAGPWDALYPGDGASGWGAYSGQVPAMLQFSSSCTIAGQTTCDADAYRGTLAQLTALVAPGWSTPMATDLTPAALVQIRDLIRDQIPLGVYDLAWSMANGVNVNGIDYGHVAAPTRDNLRVVLGGPVDQLAILNAVAAVGGVDMDALLAGLLPGIVAAVKGALAGTDQRTDAQIVQIVIDALKGGGPAVSASAARLDYLHPDFAPSDADLTADDLRARDQAAARQARIEGA